MSKVPVFDEGRIIARVEYSDNLDFWDGRNFTSGSTGRHLGITKLRDGRFVLIYGSQYEGERDTAEIVNDDEALQAVLFSQNEAVLKRYFPGNLKKLDAMEDPCDD